METIKENKGKEVVDEITRQEVQSQPHPVVGDKRKNLSKAIGLENLPSRRKEKRVKHRSSKPRVVKLGLPILPTPQQPSIQIQDIDSSEPASIPSSKTIVPTSSQPSQRVLMNLLENKDLAWERFEKAVIARMWLRAMTCP